MAAHVQSRHTFPCLIFLAFSEVSRASGHCKLAVLDTVEWDQDALGSHQVEVWLTYEHVPSAVLLFFNKNSSGVTPMGLGAGRVPAALQ